MCDRQKGCQLAGTENAHEKGLHSVVMVMGVGHFVETVGGSKGIDGAAPYDGTGIAGVFAVIGGDGARDICLNGVKRHIQGAAEIRQGRYIEVSREPGIQVDGGQFERARANMPQAGQGIGQEGAVFAT